MSEPRDPAELQALHVDLEARAYAVSVAFKAHRRDHDLRSEEALRAAIMRLDAKLEAIRDLRRREATR